MSNPIFALVLVVIYY